MIRKASSNLWLAVAVLAGAVVLLVLVVSDLGGGKLALPPLTERRDGGRQLVPVRKIEQLSTNLASVPMRPFANGKHPFFTLHFKPKPPPVVVVTPVPVAPPPPPPPQDPPPPEMRKVNLLYQGVYQTSDGRHQAFVVVDGKLSVMPLGTSVAGDWVIAEIGRQNLTLTNASAQTNILEFNRARELEIPVIKR